MKREKEIYLKPLTHREQVVMEQGICIGSVDTPIESSTKAKAMEHSTGFESGNSDFNNIEWK